MGSSNLYNGNDNPEFLYSESATTDISEISPTAEYQKIASFSPRIEGQVTFFMNFKRIQKGSQENYSIEYLSIRKRSTGEEIYSGVCEKSRSPEYYFWALPLYNLSVGETYDWYIKYELHDEIARHVYVPTELKLQAEICQKRDKYLFVKNEV